MPIRRNNKHGNTGKMHSIRSGGRVSLFNYNPSIAGGKIAVKRFGRAHYMGVPMRNWQEKHLASMIGAQGQGLMAPGSHAASMRGGAVKDSRKRILDGLSAQFSKKIKSGGAAQAPGALAALLHGLTVKVE